MNKCHPIYSSVAQNVKDNKKYVCKQYHVFYVPECHSNRVKVEYVPECHSNQVKVEEISNVMMFQTLRVKV